jgi:TonB-linked SusC/RagA family outer membrane protein
MFNKMLKAALIMLAVCLTSTNMLAQSLSILVQDTNGRPIPGAVALVKGTTDGVVANDYGVCILNNVGDSATILLSCIGYEDAVITPGTDRRVIVTLQESNLYLNELVVIGYGTQRRKDITGSISKIKGDKISEFSTFSAASSLEGRVAGVQVSSADGAPGGTVQVRVRGTNSLKGSNEPLWVINGFPGDINMINTEDIESIEVLKDASATAIYGSRGANGVIIVTTKKAKEGKIQVTYNGSLGFQKPVDKIKMCNAEEYMDFYNKYADINGTPIAYTADQIAANKYDTDWLAECTHTAPISSHGLDITGGTQKVQANLGVSYFDQEGIMMNTDYKRFLIRSEANYNLSKYASADAKIIFSRVNQNKMDSNGVNSINEHIYAASPVASPYAEDGSWNNMAGERSGVNPLAALNYNKRLFLCNRVQMEGGFTIRPFDGLSIILRDALYTKDDRFDYFRTSECPSGVSEGSISLNSNIHFVSNNLIQYDKSFGKHSFFVMTGVTYENSVSKGVGTGVAEGFMSDILETYNIQAAVSKTGLPTSSFSEWTLFSYLARLNYNYDNRYLFTASYRADGSSRYSPGNKWGYFPSAAFAWKISEEDFMKGAGWLDDLKLRISYGETGSTAINPYATIDQLQTYTAVFDGNTTTCYATHDTYNRTLKWETTAQANAGIDFSAFNNRLNITADYYYKKTTDLLNDVEMPRSSGYTKSLQNIGSLENKGFEFSINGDIIDNAFKWNVDFNIAFNKSKVLSLANNNADIFGNTVQCTLFSGQLNLVRVGEPLFVFYGYQEEGYTDDGNLKYVNIDESEDGKITTLDRTIIGDPNPDFTFGFNTYISFKGFTLSAFFDGSYGNDMFCIPAANLNFFYTEGKNITKDMYYNHWTPENTNAKYPNILKVLDLKMSDRYVYDASYIKCKNIEFAYNFSCKRLNIFSSARVYISGQNLFTITKYPFADPSSNHYAGSAAFRQGVDYFAYPFNKSITVGCRLVF